MTAISAASATESHETANPFPDTAERTVLLPGSPATYANRAYLRDMGLHWDPERHQWHGTTTVERVRVLRERFNLAVRCFGTLEPPRGPSPPRPTAPRVLPSNVATPVREPDPVRRARDGARTRFESRVPFGGPDVDEDAEDQSIIATPTRRFSRLEVTSGLPDDSREEDERATERRLRDMRGRVKVARAVVATTPGLAETLRRDWQKAARFYARFGITEAQLRLGVWENLT